MKSHHPACLTIAMIVAAYLPGCTQRAAVIDRLPLEPGVTFRVYDVGAPMNELFTLVPDQTPNLDVLGPSIRFDADAWGKYQDYTRAEVLGYIRFDKAGMYGFKLISDDAAIVRLDGEEVLTTPNDTGAFTVEAHVHVESGLLPYHIDHFDNRGSQRLILQWRPPGADGFTDIPPGNLFTEAGVTRVVAPGPKYIMDGNGIRRPGDRMPLNAVHPGFTIERIRPDSFKPQIGAMAFLDNGMLAVTTFTPKNEGAFLEEHNAKLLVLENVTDDDPDNLIIHEIASDLHAPLGAVLVDASLYVSDSDAIYKFTDRDGDGIPEHKQVLADGWTFDNYHHFTFGLLERDGYLYAALSTAINFGDDVIEGKIVGLNGPKHECYKSMHPLPYAAMGQGMAMYDGRLYLAGGEDVPRHRVDYFYSARLTDANKR